MRSRLLNLLLLVLGSAAAQAAIAAPRIVAGQNATVCGILGPERHFGPPDFDQNPKTDSTFNAWILHAAKPVAVIDPRDSKRRVETERVRLYFKHGRDGSAWLGRTVCVSGRSAEAITPGGVAPVSITVDTVRPD